METNRRSRGFTLMESLVALSILAFSVAAVTTAITAGQQQTYYSMHKDRAFYLGEAMMEEILAHPYAASGGGNNAGPESGETRYTYNNADDYHGFSEAMGALRDADNVLYPDEYQVFSRAVTASFTSINLSGYGNVSGLTVTVTVSDAKGVRCTLTRFIKP